MRDLSIYMMKNKAYQIGRSVVERGGNPESFLADAAFERYSRTKGDSQTESHSYPESGVTATALQDASEFHQLTHGLIRLA